MTDQISPARPLETIQGVFTVPLNIIEDERGRFMETFRREWLPAVHWDRIQTNRSDSRAGVLRGLHYHFHQIDYWVVINGSIRAGLADLRQTSPTCGAALTLDMSADQPFGLFIPSGVAHGFYAVTDCTLMYLVNNYYDGGRDELGVAWDDPELGLDWGLDAPPILSGRDQQNPRLHDISPSLRP